MHENGSWKDEQKGNTIKTRRKKNKKVLFK